MSNLSPQAVDNSMENHVISAVGTTKPRVSGTAIKDRPILYSAPMVLAVIDDSKTQTRRIVKPDPGPYWYPTVGLFNPTVIKNGGYEAPGPEIFGAFDETCGVKCPYGKPGDRLWVREAWAAGACADGLAPSVLHPGTWQIDNGGLWYAADGAEPWHPISRRGRWRPSIHMPRWASRITLEITGVRVERLQDISEEDARAEGAPWAACGAPQEGSHKAGFAQLWESINGPDSWAANPWVWVVEFKRIKP